MIKVLITSDTRYPLDKKVVRAAVEDTFKKFKIENASVEVSVSVVGARKMKKLTVDFAGDSKKHQILTFALQEESTPKFISGQGLTEAMPAGGGQGFINPPDDTLRLGDVVLCWPEVVSEAAEDEMMVDDKIHELIAHGVEHLLGKHHEN